MGLAQTPGPVFKADSNLQSIAVQATDPRRNRAELAKITRLDGSLPLAGIRHAESSLAITTRHTWLSAISGSASKMTASPALRKRRASRGAPCHSPDVNPHTTPTAIERKINSG